MLAGEEGWNTEATGAWVLACISLHHDDCHDSVIFHIKVSPVFNFSDQIGMVIAL